MQVFWHPPEHVPIHVFLHVLSQEPLHVLLQELQFVILVSTALAITGLLITATTPMMGNAFFAASLKNSLLLWVSLFFFMF